MSMALGFLIGTCPLVGMHTVSCIFLTALFRLNQIVALGATMISVPLLILLLYPNVKLGAMLSGMPMAGFSGFLEQFQTARERMGMNPDSNLDVLMDLFAHAGTFLIQALLGWLILGLLTALLTYGATMILLKTRRASREKHSTHAVD
jgi:uncharacterized protein (DUF2062 family)